MTVAAAIPGKFDIGRVANMTFSVVRSHFVPFFVLGLIATAPNAFFSVATTTNMAGNTGNATMLIAGIFGSLFVGMLFSFILQAAVSYGTVAHLNNQPVLLGKALMTGVREILPLLAIALLEGLGIGLGFIVLIVPGIILFVMWSVVVPIRVIEQKRILEVFGRSSELTSGYRWPIFGTMAVYYIGAGVAQFSVRPLAAAGLTTGMTWTYVGLNTLITAVVAVVAAVGISCIYYELRVLKEGIGPEQVAAVFE